MYTSDLNRAVNFSDFEFLLQYYGNDISEKEHAAEIVRRLRLYEKDAKRLVEKIQRMTRQWEDRFPELAEDPSAFEVATPK
jgi:hypothetical protein